LMRMSSRCSRVCDEQWRSPSLATPRLHSVSARARAYHSASTAANAKRLEAEEARAIEAGVPETYIKTLKELAAKPGVDPVMLVGAEVDCRIDKNGSKSAASTPARRGDAESAVCVAESSES